MRGRFYSDKKHSIQWMRGIVFSMTIRFIFLTLAVLQITTWAQPLASGKDKFLGAATSHVLSRYLEKYFNQVTPGNAGKWGSVEAVRGQYYWNDLDKIYNFAINRNFPFKEHTLVWGQQQPGWISSLAPADQRQAIEDWIKAIGNRYPKLSFVDVVNEPLHAPPMYKDALGGDGVTGWDWVITAFQLARQYCAPNVQLHLNDYNILHDNNATTKYINLISLLKDRGLIDGVCIQGHYFEFRSDINTTGNKYVYDLNTIKANLDRLAAVGLPIYISEFDIDEPNDADQLAQYQIYFPIFWCHPAVKGITFWGYIQGDVWGAHPNTYLLLANGTERPALQWLKTFVNLPYPPIIISPIGSGGEPRNPILRWHSSKTATSYRVQVAISSLFTPTLIDTIVTDTTLTLPPLAANQRYFWRVNASNSFGSSGYSNIASFMTGEQLGVSTTKNPGEKTLLLQQNYPNPFNSITIIPIILSQPTMVRLVLVNLLGQEVKVITNGVFAAGLHPVTLNASELPSGIYFCRLQVDAYLEQIKIVLIR